MARSAQPTVREMRRVLDTLANSDGNVAAVKYAPWVLHLMIVVAIKDRAASLEPAAWAQLGLAFVVITVLGRLAVGALKGQKKAAEAALERLIRQRHGLRELSQLRRERRYGRLELSADLEHRIVQAAVAAEREDEERRERQPHATAGVSR